jgi:hypothetical protein
VKRNPSRPRLKVSADSVNVVSHAGARLLPDLADEVGLTAGLSAAMAPTKRRRRGHDRGHVLVDVAVMIADGGDAISDLAVLRDQPDLFGEVASTPTAWRALEAVDGEALERIAAARAEARRRVWAAGVDPGFYVIDFDGTLVTAHSDKQGAAPTYKRGFGHHPLLAFLDATGEALAGILRPGNAGSNTTTDHVDLLALALAQLPVDPERVEVVARADSAALTHGFVDACRDAQVRFSIGHDLTAPIRTACLAVPKRRWRPAVTADGSDEREGAEVAEITDLVDLSRWPDGTRAIARREEPHPGAQQRTRPPSREPGGRRSQCAAVDGEHRRGDPPERSRDSPGRPGRQPRAPEPNEHRAVIATAALSATITHSVATTVALAHAPALDVATDRVEQAVPARSPEALMPALA